MNVFLVEIPHFWQNFNSVFTIGQSLQSHLAFTGSLALFSSLLELPPLLAKEQSWNSDGGDSSNKSPPVSSLLRISVVTIGLVLSFLGDLSNGGIESISMGLSSLMCRIWGNNEIRPTLQILGKGLLFFPLVFDFFQSKLQIRVKSYHLTEV